MKPYLLPVAILASSIVVALPAYAANEEPVACPMIYMPVCASHQVECIKAPCYPVYETYSNSCVAESAHATVLHNDACTDTETGPIKPTQGEPYVPPKSCTAWYDGCNSCAKQENGGTICTMKACFAQGAGYCTAYATTTPPVVHPTPAPTPVPAATTMPTPVATVTPVTHEGFLVGIWHWFLHLLRR